MSKPVVLQEQFTRMVQDVPRDELPEDAAWAIYDYIPNLGMATSGSQGGRLSKRGGWMYASSDISAISSSATKITSMIVPQSVGGGTKLYYMTDNNKFCVINIPGGNTNTPTEIATTGVQSKQNFLEIGGKIVILANDGTTAPKSYDGTTFGNLAGSPPTCQFGAMWKDRLWIGNTSTLKNRTYASGVDDATVWDTTNSWFDCIADITGYAALPNVLLIFGANQTARVRGSIPPPGGDLILDDPIFSVGCTFPTTIAVNGPLAAFANEEGVFLTNGTNQPQDLTDICGVKSTWQYHTAQRYVPGMGAPSFTVKAWGGFIGNYYLACLNPTNANIARAFLFDLSTRSCVLLKNITISSLVMSPQIGDDLYVGIGKRLTALSPIFNPTSTNKSDEDGTAITPELHTRYYTDSNSWNKRWRYLFVDYECVDAASDNPTLSASYVKAPSAVEGTVHTSLGTLPETTSGNPITRAKMPIRTSAPGIAFKITQTNTSKLTVINALLADVHTKEASRVS